MISVGVADSSTRGSSGSHWIGRARCNSLRPPDLPHMIPYRFFGAE
jgi:hypothetical protein